MRILWLHPLDVTKPSDSMTPKDFMVSKNNEIARSIKLLGHEITGVFCYVEERAEMNGFSAVIYFQLKKPKWLYTIFYHLEMLITATNQKYDAILLGVHSSHLIPFLKLLSFFQSHKPTLVLDIRSVPVDLKKDIRSKIEMFRYNSGVKLADYFCDGLTCITPMLGETVKPKLNRLRDKLGYFETGVNLKIFDPSNSSSSLKKTLKLDGKFILLYHGVLSPNRGIQEAVKAVAICKKKIPDLLFLIVGTGAGESELRTIAKDMKLDENILFTGAVPIEQIPDFIRSADVGIIPLPAIGWWNVSSPIKLKEYLAMQLPVIATDIPAHRFVVEKAGGATLIKSHEASHIAEAVLDFYRSRKTTFPIKPRKDLLDIISFRSQSLKLIDYMSKIQ